MINQGIEIFGPEGKLYSTFGKNLPGKPLKITWSEAKNLYNAIAPQLSPVIKEQFGI